MNLEAGRVQDDLDRAAKHHARGRYRAALEVCRRAQLHLGRSRQHAELRVHLWLQIGDSRLAAAEVHLAKTAYQRARAAARKTGLEELIAAAENGLGMTYKQLGRHRQAFALYQNALATFKRLRGERDAAIAAIYHNLGGIEHARGKLARAEFFARRGVAIRERLAPRDRLSLALDRAALAAILVSRRSYREAEQLFRKASSIIEKELGRSHPEVGYLLSNLAVLCHEEDRLDEARAWYRRALRIEERTLGRGHPELKRTRMNYRRLEQDLGTIAVSGR